MGVGARASSRCSPRRRAPGAASLPRGHQRVPRDEGVCRSPSFDMRISQLTITKPDGLTAAKNPVVAGILSDDVTPNLPECNLLGNGTFSWLLSFDLANSKLRTGTATFNAGPNLPYSFSAGSVPGGLGVDFPLAPGYSGTWCLTRMGASFSRSGAGRPSRSCSSEQEYVLLPLVNVAVAGHVSPEHNCIGAYDVASLDPANSCLPSTFKNDGSIAALIPLAAADEAAILSLKQSMCVLLTGAERRRSHPDALSQGSRDRHHHGAGRRVPRDGRTGDPGLRRRPLLQVRLRGERRRRHELSRSFGARSPPKEPGLKNPTRSLRSCPRAAGSPELVSAGRRSRRSGRRLLRCRGFRGGPPDRPDWHDPTSRTAP